MAMGGKREGAGRKPKFGEKTVVVRIPESILATVKMLVENQNSGDFLQIKTVQNQQINDIKNLIKSYESNANDSPRWAFAKKLLKELDLILNPKI
jgi:hypothetical protein